MLGLSPRASLATAAVGATTLGLLGRRLLSTRAAKPYVLHVYDHCPFCNRVEWLMSHYGISYTRVLYGYGAGAKPEKCEGHGYPEDGPNHLTGQKMLPVLQGPDVPCAPGALGMPESMEICAYLIGAHKLVAPCESGRADIKAFTKELTEFKAALVEDRMVRMPIADWADERDVGYRRWKKKVPMPPPPLQAQPELCEKVSAKLAELPKLLRGGTCLNEWGWGIDDVVLLPLLRAFTVVKGVRFPPEVVAYLGIEATQMTDYRRHAC